MVVQLSERDENYRERLNDVCDEIEDILRYNLLDYKKARSLAEDYSKLVKEIFDDPELTERDKDSWATAIAHAYEPSYNQLIIRIHSAVIQ